MKPSVGRIVLVSNVCIGEGEHPAIITEVYSDETTTQKINVEVFGCQHCRLVTMLGYSEVPGQKTWRFPPRIPEDPPVPLARTCAECLTDHEHKSVCRCEHGIPLHRYCRDCSSRVPPQLGSQ